MTTPYTYRELNHDLLKAMPILPSNAELFVPEGDLGSLVLHHARGDIHLTCREWDSCGCEPARIVDLCVRKIYHLLKEYWTAPGTPR
jgi:hypothetical protein